MEFGTAVAVIAFCDQCLKYGEKFVKRCRSYLHAEEEAVELLVAIESNWVKMETQIEMLKKIAGSLNQRLQAMQARVLSQLEGKLKTASLVMDKLLNDRRKNVKRVQGSHSDGDIAAAIKELGNMRALKKAKCVSQKRALYQIVDEIERWQARYDPSWFFIMQGRTGDIYERLDEQQREQKEPKRQQIPIILAAQGIRHAARAAQNGEMKKRGPVWIDLVDLSPSSIPYSSVELSSLQDGKEAVIIDTMMSNPAANAKQTLRGVRNLARILAEVDPSTFGLLKCRGVIKVPGKPKDSHSPKQVPPLDFQIIFSIPSQLSRPQSLRDILLSGTRYPLNERVDLAKRLANSILFVHSVQFVHKNIRPETIIVFRNEHSDIGASFLVGFQQFRVEDGGTYRTGDDIWEHNLYRHPSRQGTHPEVDYEMQHDIYSLGVVLLEIGLWTSFVLYGKDEETCSPVRSDILGSADWAARPRNTPGSANRVKRQLEDVAARELPCRLGKRYTDVVLLCLRCLDAGSGANHDGQGLGVGAVDCTDEDGVVLGVSYIENVLEKLHSIMV